MKKFNWKSRGVIASFLTVLLMGFGVYSEVYVTMGTEAVCAGIKCDA